MREADALAGDLDHARANGVVEILDVEPVERGAKQRPPSDRPAPLRRTAAPPRLHARAPAVARSRPRAWSGSAVRASPRGRRCARCSSAPSARTYRGLPPETSWTRSNDAPRDLAMRARRLGDELVGASQRRRARRRPTPAAESDRCSLGHSGPSLSVRRDSTTQIALVSDPAQRERQHAGRGSIEPLLIVDRDHERRLGSESLAARSRTARGNASTSVGASDASLRNSAAPRARRCGSGKLASASAPSHRTDRPEPENANAASASAGAASRTQYPAPAPPPRRDAKPSSSRSPAAPSTTIPTGPTGTTIRAIARSAHTPVLAQTPPDPLRRAPHHPAAL